MQLLILRHGEAEARAATDAERALTPRGQQQAQAVGQWLASQGLRPDVVVSSPYRRAQETAAAVLAGAAWAAALPTVTCEALVPEGDPRQVERWLAARPEPLILVVSHMPLVAQLLSWLDGGVLTEGVGFGLAELRGLELPVMGAGQGVSICRFQP